MPRLFTGIEIPASIGMQLSMLRGGLPGARWIDPENYHITLRFLGDNRRMQQLARKFDADLKFDFGSVVGEVDPPRFTVLSLAREWTEDAFGVVNAMLDAQARLVRAG